MTHFLKKLYSYVFNSNEEKVTPRAVCILGALKTMIFGELMMKHSKMFEMPKRTITDSPFSFENPGKVFHFVSEAKMLEDIGNDLFIEHSKEENHITGLSFAAVSQTLDKGSHCLIYTDRPQSIERMKSLKGLEPLVILIDASSSEEIMFKEMYRSIITTAGVALYPCLVRDMFRQAQKDKNAFGDLITHTISASLPFQEVVQQLLNICNDKSQPEISIA